MQHQSPGKKAGHTNKIQRPTRQLQPSDKLLIYSDGAEPFIGKFDDTTGFGFTEEFLQVKDLPIVEMMDKLNTIAHNQKISPSEIDDITIVGFEINS